MEWETQIPENAVLVTLILVCYLGVSNFLSPGRCIICVFWPELVLQNSWQ